MSATIDELTVADEPAAWEGLGFAVEGDICVVGDVRIHLAGPHAGERLAGLDLRRIREQPTPAGAPRQAFLRLGATILEVVQEPPEAIERAGGDHAAFFWGLAFLAPDLDATVASLGEHASEVRDAVQPGRRIATLRRSAGLALPVALISPRPPRD